MSVQPFRYNTRVKQTDSVYCALRMRRAVKISSSGLTWIGVTYLSTQLIRTADNGCVLHGRMLHQCTLDLVRTNPVPTHPHTDRQTVRKQRLRHTAKQ